MKNKDNETKKEIRYADLFGGVGGFRLGIEKAWRSINNGKQEEISNSERNKSILEGQQENNNKGNIKEIEPTENSSGTLFQNRRLQSNSLSRDLETNERDNEFKQQMGQGSNRYLLEGNGIRDEEESLLQYRSKPNIGSWGKPNCVFYNDIDKYAVQTYNKNFNENHEATDIRTIEADSIPDIDMLCGGFPCQTFSIAGKRRGFEDTRGTLFFEIARIIKVKKPKIVFLENVKGLLNHDKGQTFSIIIQTLSELGYNVQWMVLNSKFFGVPQNRERVFIIGSIRGTSRPEILPFGRINSEDNELPGYEETTNTIHARITADSNGTYIEGRGETQEITHGTITEAIGRQGSSKEYLDSLNKIKISQQGCQAQRVFNPKGIAPTLRGLGGGQGAKTGLYMMDLYNNKLHSNRSPALKEPHHNTLRVMEFHPAQLVNKNRAKKPYNPNDREMKIKVRDDDTSYTVKSATHEFMVAERTPLKFINRNQKNIEGDYSFTIDSANTGGIKQDMKIRRLAPIECERLQGFPDGWTEKGKVFKCVKLFGNVWKNVQLKDVKEKYVIGNQNSVLNITRDGKNGEVLILSIPNKEGIKESVKLKGVIEKHIVKNGVCDTINLGKDMVMLSKVKETSEIEEITKQNLILEKMEEKSTYPLWKITLEEKSKKEKLSTILTLIKETILSQTFICSKTEKPITKAIIVWSKLEQNSLKKESLNLVMEDIIQMSDTQRYKQMGNAVTVNVIQAIAEKLLK